MSEGVGANAQMASSLSLFQELPRRQVSLVAAMYVVTAWLLLQVVGVMSDPLHLLDWFAAVVLLILVFL
tara:strand:- start:5415 stop:5621 length:207 start_codon:yes stop_codon:yes gene_type:complete